MANPRDLAEQAFALLQSALRDSEARASDLDEQLKKKRSPKNRLEEQLDVLTHRLESVEAERVRWEHQAGHLEEVAEAERVKVAQLKKKLEIAESGPEKLTKKEINFWRAKAEDIDTETKDYKERLASLRRELMERDAVIETLRRSPATAAPEAASETVATGESSELRRQLEQRDQWLAELRLELHGLRAQGTAEPEPPLEALAEIETLRRQIASFEHALADAHNTRAAVQADLGRAQHDLGERDRVVREVQATSERTRTAIEEREHRIVQLSAELEHLRSDLRQREQQHREGSAQRDDQIAALARDLDALRARAQQEHHDAAAAQAELGRLNAAVSLAEQRNHHLSTELARLQNLLAERERTQTDAATTAESLQRSLDERDADLERVKQQLAEREHDLTEHRQQLGEHEREHSDRQQQLREVGQRLADREEKLASLAGELEHAKTAATTNGRELSSLRDTLLGANRELDQLRNHKHKLEAELSDVLTRVDNSTQDVAAKDRELDLLREQLGMLQTQRDVAEGQLGQLQQQRDSAQEQIAGLESELKEEREHAENLGELANERREHMTKLQEQLEEAEERYEEAKWRLGKALYFERLVKRRKGLIGKLLTALRAKMKANVALKAGLDGLRTYKAAAEMNQQKLLQRIEALKTELREAEEAIGRHQGATSAKDELATSESRALELEARLNTQAELIQSLEADLKSARLVHKSDDEKHHEMERLIKELETKNQVIERLQTDTDEQQRKLSKLRGSESETVRLKALTEKDRGEIDALQREIAQLREALVRQGSGEGASANAGAAPDHAELQAKLKERENSVTRLMGTIKEHEATIKKLSETSESWKRKYQFLATDSPDAYKVAAEK